MSKDLNTRQSFYEELASFYHLIYEDWEKAIKEQGATISNLLSNIEEPILDCACGIGTQALGLASLGYKIDGSDLSKAEIKRAKVEAMKRGLSVNFRIDDMRQLKHAPLEYYGAIIAMDNALPHLESDIEIINSLAAMKSRLKKNGILLLSIRNYEDLLNQRPLSTTPFFFNDREYRRIIHQVWDWKNARIYILHLYITFESEKGWESHHFVSNYRAITVDELASFIQTVGYQEIQIFDSKEIGYHQPIIRAVKKD